MEQWKKYEDITKYIYEKLGEGIGVKIEGHGNDCKVLGKSGVHHQIDVLTSHSDGLHTYKTAIECKYWDKNVNKDIVMKIADIIEDAGINKGVIVSKKGFTPDGIAFAKYKNIGLVELREITEEDWKGRVKDIKIHINMLLPEITGFELIIHPDTKANIKERTNHLIDNLEIIAVDGTATSLRKWIEEFNAELMKQGEGQVYQKVYKFEEGSKIRDKATETDTPTLGIKLSGVLRIGKETVHIKGEEHVFMIMKSVFEEKSFTIHKDGKIIENR